ncbi:ATP-binding protein [Aureivirga marina]|uniref:ATP-binding protein n=1 Tax=Aureivirga marina TaxID=1182451 RepID=UPI0018C9F42E|nr:hypothetical protein [Aureivirga marina]
MIRKLLFIFFITFYFLPLNAQMEQTFDFNVIDSLKKIDRLMYNQKYTPTDKKQFLKNFETIIISDEKLYQKYRKKFISYSFKAQSKEFFYKYIGELEKSAIFRKDTSLLAYYSRSRSSACNVYGVYDSIIYYHDKAKYLYKLIKNDENYYKIILTTITFRIRVGDYISAEKLCIELLEAEYHPDYAYLSLLTIYQKLEWFDKFESIMLKMDDYLKNTSDDVSIIKKSFLITKGEYFLKKKDYDKAIEIFKEVISEYDTDFKKKFQNINFEKEDEFEQMNFAYFLTKLNNAYLLKGEIHEEFLQDFIDALEVTEYFYEQYGWVYILEDKIMILNSIGEYYYHLNDFKKSEFYLKKSIALAKKINHIEHYKEGVKKIIRIDSDLKIDMLNEYIEFNKKYQKEQYKKKGKFSMIRFEADQLKLESVSLEILRNKLKKQNQTYSISLAFFLLFFVLYLIYIQKNRNKKLQLENEKQEMQIAVFQLSEKLHENLIREKLREKFRISSELHDGVLTRFLGLRLLMNYSKINLDKQQKLIYEGIINSLQKIENKAREISHELNECTEVLEIREIFEIILEEKLKELKPNLKYEITSNVPWENFEIKDKMKLFYILNNFLELNIKITKPTKISISLQKKIGRIVIEIKDNGSFFSKYNSEIKKIQKKLQLMDGEMMMHTEFKKGKIVKIIFHNKD